MTCFHSERSHKLLLALTHKGEHVGSHATHTQAAMSSSHKPKGVDDIKECCGYSLTQATLPSA